MIRPPLPRRPGTPRQFRALFILFAIRHLLSLVVFAYLTYLAWQTGSTFFYVMAAIMIVFQGFAAFQGRKIWGQYRRSSQRAASIAAEQSGK